jgi:hypothetical protein
MKTWSTNISATDLDRRWSRRKIPLLNIDVVEKRNKRMATKIRCLKGYETNTARFKSPFGCQVFQTMCLNEERLACRSVLRRLLFAMASSCDGFFLRWSLINMKSNRTLAMATFAMSYSLRWQLFLILVALLRVLVRSAGLVSVLLVLVDVYFLVDCASPRSLATRTWWFENVAYTN